MSVPMNHAATLRLTDLCEIDGPGNRLFPHPCLERKLGLAFRHRRKLDATDRKPIVSSLSSVSSEKDATDLKEVAGDDELDPAERCLVASEAERPKARAIDRSA